MPDGEALMCPPTPNSEHMAQLVITFEKMGRFAMLLLS